MTSRESTGSSTRLSLDMANLPITPFGMNLHRSPKKLISSASKRINRLSRRRDRQLQAGNEDPAYCNEKENIIGMKSGPCNKQWPSSKSRNVGLYTVPESEGSSENISEPRQRKPVSPSFRELTITRNHKTNFDIPVAGNHKQDSQLLSKGSRGQRDSIYTDVDDGSFIEFCHVKDKGQCLSRQEDQSPRNMPLVYYTCDIDNDTQFSTSTKTDKALVGFHKYIEKLKVQKDIIYVPDSETEEVETENQFEIDESVITCSADLRRIFCRGRAANAINSTVIDKLPPHQAKLTAPSAFNEISALTDNSEIPSGFDLHSMVKQQAMNCSSEMEKDVISESSDDGELHSLKYDMDPKLILTDKPGKPPESLGNCHVNDKPMFAKGYASSFLPALSTKVISGVPRVVADVPGEHPSHLSEDVTIISNSITEQRKCPAVVSEKSIIYETESITIPQKNLTSKVSKTKGISTSPKGDGKEPLLYGDEKNRAITGYATTGLRPESFKDGKAETLGQAKPFVHKWVMTSPFKESSFDSSFLHKREISYISESPSQPKVYCSGEVTDFHTRKLKTEYMRNYDAMQRKSFSENIGPSLTKQVTSVSSHSESSESGFSVKQSTDKGDSIVSSSDELEDNKRNGMFVTQRRKKYSKNITASFQINYIESSDEEKNSFPRVCRSPSEPDSASRRTTQTIGKAARSPDNEVCRQSKTTHTLNKSYNLPSKRNENSHTSDFIGMKNSPSHDSSYGRKLQADVKIESVTTPHSKAGSPQHHGESGGPLDMSLIMKELDNLYSSEWRRNKEEIFKTCPKQQKQRGRIDIKSTKKDRRSRSLPRINVQISEEGRETDKNFNHQVKMRSDKINKSGDIASDVTNEHEMGAKTERSNFSSPEDDSFSDYLKKVKSSQKKVIRKIVFSSEDDDSYESSFINDESADESYSPSHIPPNPYMSPTNFGSNIKIKGSTRQREERHSNDNIRSTLPDTNEKKPKTKPKPLDSSEDNSFEEYLKKVKFCSHKKKQCQRSEWYSEDENSNDSSFNKDDSDESYILPRITLKPHKKSLEDVKSSTPENERKIARPKTDTKVLNTWRDSPTISLISDSDSSDSNSWTEFNQKITPQLTIRRKVLPQTEGPHPRHRKYNTVPISPRLTFLSSLSFNVNITQCHPDALPYVKNFKKKKEELVEKLYKLYNARVFDGKLPSSMNITWNPRLTKTAGYCYYQLNGSSAATRGSRIDLSSKVIDCAERLRDTLIHELCHAAAWIISGYKDGHGPLWKAWASKARTTFPELPAISRCHSYQIQCKFTYRCTRCFYSIGRHSKSLDMKKKVCGYCHGTFELLVNYKKQGQKTDTDTAASQDSKTPKTPGPFALFVKENYGSIKKSTPHLKHRDVMKLLGTKFRDMKTSDN